MGLLDIGDGLKTRLQTIPGLRVYALKELPDSINAFPSAVILPGETAYTTTFAADADYNLRVILLFSKQDTPSAISKMLPYLDVSGKYSVVAAIQEDKTLDGKADTCKVTANRGISSLNWGGISYLATEFAVQVWAD
ncbi:MAG: hypothetical protein A2Y59_06700 [Chloroflexi bacterium RBG_13_52_14]|nr:MAG: hypothetical protein A2Y59_06700 [Chloroflexi bacterium RBG_13_52_14]